MKIIKTYKTYLNKLDKLDDGTFVVRDNNTQSKNINFGSERPLNDYSRRHLSYTEIFLREAGETETADKIKEYLGKIIRCNEIPELIPVGNYRVNIPLDMLKKKIELYIEEDGLDLNPDFQRAHVWNTDQRVAFVEFILQGGKTNPIYFNHPGWMKGWEGNMVIVDGKQRLTAILMFLNNEITVFKELDEGGIGYYAREFNHFGADLIFVINDLPTRKKVLEWYLQINKGNVAHTSDEISKVEALLKKED